MKKDMGNMGNKREFSERATVSFLVDRFFYLFAFYIAFRKDNFPVSLRRTLNNIVIASVGKPQKKEKEKEPLSLQYNLSL